MTKGQASYYWRLWGRVARTWNWRAHQAPRPVPPLDDYPQRVVDAARLMAGDAQPSPDHYRHAVHLVALGGHKSSKDLTSRDLDKVTALMRVLVDGNDIEARFLLDNPNIAEARRLVWRARKMAPENYIDTVCRRKFPTYQSPWWEDLPIQDLRDLVTTLSQRTQHGRYPIRAEDHAGAAAL